MCNQYRVLYFTLLLLLPVTWAFAHCDFNNDGYDDLAISAPGDDPPPSSPTGTKGAVNVLYGRPSGLSATNNQIFYADSLGVGTYLYYDDTFGMALACGDFNADGNDDLAIGIPGFTHTTATGDYVYAAGTVIVLFGSTRWRLSATRRQSWTQASPGVYDDAEHDDFFGASLAAGDFNDDGFADLAIGAPGEDVGSVSNAGAVHILKGSLNGLTGSGSQYFTEDSAGIADAPRANDHFGFALEAADFGKDTTTGCYDDLAISAPQLWSEAATASGVLHVLYGTASGLSSAESTYVNPGRVNQYYGYSLAAGYFKETSSVCGGATIADLAVGIPFIESNYMAYGAVEVFYGTPEGPDIQASQNWTQDSPGIADSNVEDPIELTHMGGYADYISQIIFIKLGAFGSELVAGRTAAGRDYLAIGAGGEALGTRGYYQMAGVVHLLYTDPSTGMLTAAGSKYLHQNVPGIKDTNEIMDWFGSSLATGNFDGVGDDDLAIGSYGEAVVTYSQFAGAVHILYGAQTSNAQWFHQNSPDIKDAASGYDQFSYALSR